MWQAARAAPPVAPLLARGGGTVERVLRVHAIPESRAWPACAASTATPGGCSVGICARDAELEITVRSAVGDAWAADALEERLAAEFGPALYSRDGATLDEVVARGLLGAGQTVAVAESCTGGVWARLTARSGSSAYVLAGSSRTPTRSSGTSWGRRRGAPPARGRLGAGRRADGRRRALPRRQRLGALGHRHRGARRWEPREARRPRLRGASPGPAASRRGSTACGATGSGSGGLDGPRPPRPAAELDAREEV